MDNFSLEFAILKFPEVVKAVPTTLLVAVISMLLGFIAVSSSRCAGYTKYPYWISWGRCTFLLSEGRPCWFRFMSLSMERRCS